MAVNRVACPDCGAVLRLPPDMSDGESITCPKCDTSFVPDFEAGDGGAVSQKRSRKRLKNESKTALVVASVILGAVLLVGGTVAAVLLLVVRPALKNEPVVQAPPPAEPIIQPKMPFPPPNANLPPRNLTPPSPPIRKPSNPGGPGVDVGNLALEIEAEDIDGKKFKLSDYRGKVVLLDFWGNW